MHAYNIRMDQVLGTPLHVEPRTVCATCGMTLVVPGLLQAGSAYCCHGCVPAAGKAAGATFAPPRHGALETARAIRIDAAADVVSRFLANIELLHLYEQKLERLQVTAVSEDGRRACATADGNFGLLPFHIELHFDFDAIQGGGYKSTICDAGPITALRGGFVVAPEGAGCVVTHFENYEFAHGGTFEFVGRLFKPYIGWSMDRELRALKQLVEDPAVLGRALRLRRPHRLPIDRAAAVWDPEHPTRRA